MAVVDWKEVERLRAKGWDWPSIAEEPRVKFSPPEGSGDSGRALKTLYLNRKSQKSRSSRSGSVADEDVDLRSPASRSWSHRLFVAGAFVAPLAGAWAIIAILFPSPFGVLVTFFPQLVIGLVFGFGLLGASFVIGVTDLRGVWVKPVAVGLVVGLVAVGISGYVARTEGAPTLHPGVSYAGGTWTHAPNDLWTSGGKPVIFFMGSAACPYCSASSWAIRMALQKFGTFTGGGPDTSSPSDIFPNTPEWTLYGTSLSGPYLVWDPEESSDNQKISQPALSVTESAYQVAYDPTGSIPFVVFGGVYMHAGTFVDPAALTTGQAQGTPAYSIAAVEGQLANQSGPCYSAILAQAQLIEAYFCEVDRLANIQPPTSVLSDPAVVSAEATIPTPP